MEGRRRTIEVDEEVAIALERRAAERGVSVDKHLGDLMSADAGAIELPAEDLAELNERIDEWERDRLGVPAEQVFARLRARIGGQHPPALRYRRY